VKSQLANAGECWPEDSGMRSGGRDMSETVWHDPLASAEADGGFESAGVTVIHLMESAADGEKR
jgi:hypothetical protein